jgi:hypothetical protein
MKVHFLSEIMTLLRAASNFVITLLMNSGHISKRKGTLV